MSNSLTLNGIEVVSSSAGANPPYYLQQADQPGQDYGEILPDTDTISSVLLDGDVISGVRTGNRTWNLTVVCAGVNRAGLAANVNALIEAVNQQTFSVVWTPDGQPASVFTAFRATFQISKSFPVQANFYQPVTLSFDTFPFAKSMEPTTVSVTATGGAVQYQIDGMNSGTFTNGTLNTSTKYEGAGSMAVTMTRSIQGANRYSYESGINCGRAVSSVDLSSYTSFSIRVQWAAAPASYRVIASLTLNSASGSSTCGAVFDEIPGDTNWELAMVPASEFIGNADMTAITSWSVILNAPAQFIATLPPATTTAYVDDLRTYPPGSVSNATTNGSVITLPAVAGSARTPAAFEIDLNGSVFTNLLVHSPPVDQDPDLAILLGLSGGTETVPSANMNYDGTYGVVVFANFTGGGSRTVTVTFTQKASGVTIGTPQSVSVVCTNVASIISLGNITLPLVGLTPENTFGSLVVSVTSTGGSDTFSSVALCDTEGQTVLLTGLTSTTEAVYLDAPDPLVGAGPIYASNQISRIGAYNVMGNLAAMPGGPILLEPGDNRILVASGWGAPNLTATYYPSWLDEALS